MNFRQIHLDFHTSEHIPGVGGAFSKAQFQQALKTGHVNSITVFSKCHHGWAYHPSVANEMHPNLAFDLLGAQIEAAHEAGVKTPVYLSAGMDEKIAKRHPEWLVRTRDDRPLWGIGFNVPGFHKLCMNTPYLDYLLAQIKEVCMHYDADGIFLDIVGVQPCFCRGCAASIEAKGLDPLDEQNVFAQAEETYAYYTKQVRETIDSVKHGLPVFHNSGHIARGRQDLAKVNSHLELESLPTGGWGYDHFPLSAAYARTLDMEFLGMTGKFHRFWGEFGGFKHPNALRYEAALSAANGAGCSVGDQLHPNGKMDMATYSLVGTAYAELEAKEPWLDGAVNLADIAVLSAEATANYYANPSDGINNQADAGCARVLLEGKYLFNFVDVQADLTEYKVVILPDTVVLDEFLTKKLDDFCGDGGKLLVTGDSGLNIEKADFALDLKVEYLGEARYSPDYLRPGFEIEGAQISEFVMYARGQRIKSRGAQVLGERVNPYFNRTAAHFCSHQHAPANPDDREAGITLCKTGAYIAWNVFEEYAVNGSFIARNVVFYLLDLLLGEEKTLKTNLSAQGTVTVTRQGERQIVHLLYASPVKRGNGVEVIEDLPPVYNVQVALLVPKQIRRVYLAPQNIEIEFQQSGNRVTYVLPRLECHQIVVAE